MSGETPGIDHGKSSRNDTLIGTPDFESVDEGNHTLVDIGEDMGGENPLDAIATGENGPGIFIPPLEMLDDARKLIRQMTNEERQQNAEKIAAVERAENFYKSFLDSAKEKLAALNTSQFKALDSREREVLQRWADALPEGNEFKAKVETAIERSKALKAEQQRRGETEWAAEQERRTALAIEAQRDVVQHVEENPEGLHPVLDGIPDGYARQLPALSPDVIRNNAPTIAVPKLQAVPVSKNIFGRVADRIRGIFG
jgi:hypothetical protein